MAKVDEAVTGAAASKEPAKADSKAVAEEKAPKQEASQEQESGMEANFNPSAATHTYVLADGTRVADGDVVSNEVFSELQDVELDGVKLLAEEEGE